MRPLPPVPTQPSQPLVDPRVLRQAAIFGTPLTTSDRSSRPASQQEPASGEASDPAGAQQDEWAWSLSADPRRARSVGRLRSDSTGRAAGSEEEDEYSARAALERSHSTGRAANAAGSGAAATDASTAGYMDGWADWAADTVRACGSPPMPLPLRLTTSSPVAGGFIRFRLPRCTGDNGRL